MAPLAFESAGRAPGVEKFLVRNLDAVRIDPGLLPVFHTGALPCAVKPSTIEGRASCQGPSHILLYVAHARRLATPGRRLGVCAAPHAAPGGWPGARHPLLARQGIVARAPRNACAALHAASNAHIAQPACQPLAQSPFPDTNMRKAARVGPVQCKAHLAFFARRSCADMPTRLGQDDASTAAVLATTLQRLLGGAPRRYRELQGAESSLFRLARTRAKTSSEGAGQACFPNSPRKISGIAGSLLRSAALANRSLELCRARTQAVVLFKPPHAPQRRKTLASCSVTGRVPNTLKSTHNTGLIRSLHLHKHLPAPRYKVTYCGAAQAVGGRLTYLPCSPPPAAPGCPAPPASPTRSRSSSGPPQPTGSAASTGQLVVGGPTQAAPVAAHVPKRVRPTASFS